MNFFDHKDLGNHLLQLCPKVVKHPVYITHFIKLIRVCNAKRISRGRITLVLISSLLINVQNNKV